MFYKNNERTFSQNSIIHNNKNNSIHLGKNFSGSIISPGFAVNNPKQNLSSSTYVRLVPINITNSSSNIHSKAAAGSMAASSSHSVKSISNADLLNAKNAMNNSNPVNNRLSMYNYEFVPLSNSLNGNMFVRRDSLNYQTKYFSNKNSNIDNIASCQKMNNMNIDQQVKFQSHNRLSNGSLSPKFFLSYCRRGSNICNGNTFNGSNSNAILNNKNNFSHNNLNSFNSLNIKRSSVNGKNLNGTTANNRSISSNSNVDIIAQNSFAPNNNNTSVSLFQNQFQNNRNNNYYYYFKSNENIHQNQANIRSQSSFKNNFTRKKNQLSNYDSESASLTENKLTMLSNNTLMPNTTYSITQTSSSTTPIITTTTSSSLSSSSPNNSNSTNNSSTATSNANSCTNSDRSSTTNSQSNISTESSSSSSSRSDASTSSSKSCSTCSLTSDIENEVSNSVNRKSGNMMAAKNIGFSSAVFQTGPSNWNNSLTKSSCSTAISSKSNLLMSNSLMSLRNKQNALKNNKESYDNLNKSTTKIFESNSVASFKPSIQIRFNRKQANEKSSNLSNSNKKGASNDSLENNASDCSLKKTPSKKSSLVLYQDSGIDADDTKVSYNLLANENNKPNRKPSIVSSNYANSQKLAVESNNESNESARLNKGLSESVTKINIIQNSENTIINKFQHCSPPEISLRSLPTKMSDSFNEKLIRKLINENKLLKANTNIKENAVSIVDNTKPIDEINLNNQNFKKNDRIKIKESSSKADFTPQLVKNVINKSGSILKKKLGISQSVSNSSHHTLNHHQGQSKASSNQQDLEDKCSANNDKKNYQTNYRASKVSPNVTNTRNSILIQSFSNMKANNNLSVKSSNNSSNNNQSHQYRSEYIKTNSISNELKTSISNAKCSSSNDQYYLPPRLSGSQMAHRNESRNSSIIKSVSPSANKKVYAQNSDVVAANDKLLIAINDYVAIYSKNLSLKKGERYTLLNKNNTHWYFVKDKFGNTGYAPTNYFKAFVYDRIYSLDTSHLDKEWFHNNLTRSQAYTLLVNSNNENGNFLVRNNSTEKDKFTLCIYKSGKVYNYKINYQEGKFYITNKNKFNNLIDLIEYYKKNSAGLVCNLKNPVKRNVLEKGAIFDKNNNETIKVSLDNLDSIYKKFTIERKDIEFFEKIGSGQFGVVIKAEYKKRKIVAVKKMKPGSKEDEMNFNREAEFMMKLQNLQEFQHRNLVQFFGLSKDVDDSILIVTEFVKYGSLFNYLQKHKDRIINSKSRFLRLMNICMDVCDGMEYLESRHIVHRDLATRNCLVGDGEVIKVADFGLARFTNDYYIAHPQSQFPVKWSAPEVIKYRSYSNKSDVWSFACLMYEVFTLGKMPYGGSTTNSVAAKQIISGILPERPPYCPSVLYETVMTKAWSKDNKDRPSFKELVKLLCEVTS